MANIKCNKCGAEFPDWASFCPGCGTPKAAATSAPAPAYHPIQRSINPFEGIFNMAFSKTGIILVLAVGILLAWIGKIILIFAPDEADIAALLYSIGFAGMGLFLVSGGIWNNKIDKFVRLGIVIMGVFLMLSLFTGTSVSEILQSLSGLIPSY